jgi:protein-disulfide isomerase
VAIVILLAVVILASWRNADVIPQEELATLVTPNLDGLANTPVKVVEYADLTCSACRQWHNMGVKEQLQAEFGDQVSFEYRHFPVITASSPKATEAAQCAAEQDGFWAFHDYIYENLEPYPNLSADRLKEIASMVGLERESF